VIRSGRKTKERIDVFSFELLAYRELVNPRKTEVATLAALLDANQATRWQHPRAGKRVTVWDEQVRIEGFERPMRRVMRLTERTIDAKGQLLIEPQWVLEGWSTTLAGRQFDAQAIITLYEGHGAHEQFHSEFKTDLDLERLPSGKFDTNDAVVHLAAFAYNCLRLIGQLGLTGDISPIRHPAKRRRIKTVLQEVMYRAAKFVEHARRLVLDFGRGVAAHVKVFTTVQARLCAVASP